MALQTRSESAGRRWYAVFLEPPGNIARELALFRRRLFAAFGEASALAFPEAVPLYFGARTRQEGKRLDRSALIGLLRRAWEGRVGGFRFESLLVAGEGLYLQLAGPLREFGETLATGLAELGFEAETEPPILCARGLFLCRPSPENCAALRDAASAWAPGSLGFADAALCLLRIDTGPEALAAQAWRELARAKRRTGRKS